MAKIVFLSKLVMSYKQDILSVAGLNLPWEKLSGCNILITGATGLIGSCLVEVLLSRHQIDYEIYASGRSNRSFRMRFEEYLDNPRFHFFEYDVTTPLRSEICFQYIIHAASYASPNAFASKPVEVMQANFNGVSNLLDYGYKNGLKRFLFVSTGEVYGEGDGRVFTEDYSGFVDCTNPRSCYPSCKRAAESLTISYGVEYGVDVVIARPCHVFGPHFTELDNRVFAQFFRSIVNGNDIVLKSTGEQFRSWCYVIDCVSGLLYILLRGQNGQAYNVSDPNMSFTIRRFAEIIAGIYARNIVFSLPTDVEKVGFNVVRKSLFSNDKLKSLGWEIKGSVQEKIMNCIEELMK